MLKVTDIIERQTPEISEKVRTGDIFFKRWNNDTEVGDYYMLVRVSPIHAGLISLKEGNIWSNERLIPHTSTGEPVKDPDAIKQLFGEHTLHLWYKAADQRRLNVKAGLSKEA